MRHLMFFAVAVVLVACGSVGPKRVDAQRPTISYEVGNDRQFQEAGRKADDWCARNYGLRARLVDRHPASGASDIIVFDCVR